MSAESPRRGVHKGAQVVSPQPIVDRSIIDSVAGIINDIVPQGYAGVSNSDNKETISWARFEYADINDPALYPDYNEGSSTPPLLLVLGYATGVQVWLIAATGEATEVLSWRQGVVRTLRILPNPKTDDEHVDPFEAKRPMVAICDSAGPGPQFCHISFISLKTSEQVKSIKFKNPVCDVLANRQSVVVTFLEKIAVFDARTLEDIITITTCYASPGPNPNPVALGTRWLAYSERKLIPARRSSGGCEGEGVQSYTATVLYAAKSLGKGLRGLGETVASSLTGNSVSPMAVNSTGSDVTQPGVVTILDLQAAKEEKELDDANIETVIAHFTAHSDAIVAMTFDLTGALLMTADRRGHDFHVFRIQPHPGGPTLAAVHHLYILHRGDTTAKVQDMVFSSDTRWAAVSTVRGTTHVFPVAPYGGLVGVRTHSTPHVVNRLSRFHKSAGLTDDGTRSHSPVSHAELPLSVYPYSNPRLPPYPLPTILHPLSQIRQPSSLNHVNSSSQPRPQQRQRLHSDDGGTLPLKICVCFAPPRAWMYAQRESSSKVVKRAVDSLFIMACHGNLIQYDLEPKPAAGVPKEKVCDDTMIELEVEAKGQWPLLRTPNSSEIAPPLPLSNPLLSVTFAPKNSQELDTAEDRWLSQVEIVTHAGPHRRLWMGPQFVFKTYNAPSGVSVNLVEAEAVEIGVTSGGSRPARSKPVNMPHASSRPLMPVVIDGSGSSYEQSPRFMEAYGDPLDSENVAVGSCESQLREDLAEAMLEISIASHRAPGRRSVFERVGQPVTKVVNPLGTVITVSADEEDTVVSNSGQELFDSAEEILAPPEAPRSVCAEEGPASLGDLEPPECGQTLRDLTEICAEMRSASEPAIDSVPDENIRELRERRALCAEMLTTGPAAGSGSDVSSIDFEREEAFRDVPTSLSLCAEQGEIPSSPMTRAKETVWCCKKSGRRDERSFAKAKYVVNYDDDSVTLMENRTERNGTIDETRPPNEVSRGALRRSARRAGDSEKASDPARKRADQPARVEKYLVKEDEDSVIIEDRSLDDRLEKPERAKESTAAETGLQSTDDDLPPLDPPPLDDFSSIEYHMVAAAAQSDDDIEHIHMEMTRPEAGERVTTGSSRGQQRKSSKSTISDDDLEYIHSSELGDTPDVKSRRPESDGCSSRTAARRHSRHALSSDDDLEHVQHSEIRELESLAVENCSTEQQQAKPSGKRRKDVMVIDSEAAAEVTVIYNPLEEVCAAERKPVSPTRKAKSRAASRTSLPGKRAPSPTADLVEIIDIDAMQKAEELDAASKCKILRQDGARGRKPRKSKKWHASQSSQVGVDSSKMAEEEWREPVVAEVSWSSIVKKKLSDDAETALRKELVDLEPLMEVEERASRAKEEEDNDVGTTALNESLLVDLPVPTMFEDDEEGPTASPLYGSKNRVPAGRTTEDDTSLVSAEVVAERRQRRLVDDDDGCGDDDDAETRRGNAAVRGESQESSLQLAAARRRRRQAEGEEDRNEATGDKRSDSEERSEPLPEHSSDEPVNAATTIVTDDADNGGDNNACCADAAERNNVRTMLWAAMYASVGTKKVTSARSKRKKRR
ncbi:PREDICTED: uncharacterized protein LOC106749423 isoform X2 [Dinoponera quadriceps]|uniref:Uncharacterized protein LOC106749423 isoform X2 n=1 Tax=Dinoponera quadriceps TaxID=609295 RepID=A0A6P3Y0J4_DINQU|nr:PREDICTED: uncharacterized protein LOC106749423 isoform X2 [Dinoponera quadriceps]